MLALIIITMSIFEQNFDDIGEEDELLSSLRTHSSGVSVISHRLCPRTSVTTKRRAQNGQLLLVYAAIASFVNVRTHVALNVCASRAMKRRTGYLFRLPDKNHQEIIDHNMAIAAFGTHLRP